MKKYQKTYFTGMGYDLKSVTQANQFSEISGESANDIHHIKYQCSLPREEYPVEKLIMLTRLEHNKYGDKKQYYHYLFWIHLLTMEERNVDINFDNFPTDIVPEFRSEKFDAYHNFYKQVYDMHWSTDITYQNETILKIYDERNRLVRSYNKDNLDAIIFDLNKPVFV